MKKGRPSWTSKVSRPALERIHDAIAAQEPASAVFDRFNIGQYGCSRATFRRYWHRRRREWEDRQEGPPDAATRKASSEELAMQLIGSMQDALDAGRTIDAKLCMALTSLVGMMRLDVTRDVNRRAEDKHEAWKTEQARKQSAAADELAAARGLTPELLAEIKSRVLGI